MLVTLTCVAHVFVFDFRQVPAHLQCVVAMILSRCYPSLGLVSSYEVRQRTAAVLPIPPPKPQPTLLQQSSMSFPECTSPGG